MRERERGRERGGINWLILGAKIPKGETFERDHIPNEVKVYFYMLSTNMKNRVGGQS